ncbi:MAG: hypothetical protein NC191_05535 [Muribaculaceae bacterium]|nr:hypothetical protein [Muribaculaceae bacterium]
MLVLFFTIIFIAELIIAGWLIGHITAFDKKICALNNQVVKIQPQIKSEFAKIREPITKALAALDKFVEFMADQGVNCKEQLKKCILSKILTAILKIPFKQISAILDIALTIKKLLK